MRLTGSILLTAMLAGQACAAAERITLQALERLVDAAPAVRLAEIERIAADSRAELALAQATPRLFAAASGERVRDPVRSERYEVETLAPDGAASRVSQRLTPESIHRTRYGALVGLRVPLFGSREVALRAIDSARGDVDQQRLKGELSRMEALKALRDAYVDAYFGRRQVRLAQAYLDGQEQAMQALQLRTAAHLLLEPERKAVEATFLEARQAGSAARSAGAHALQRLAILSGHASLDAEHLAAPGLAAGCRSRVALDNALARHPDIRFHAAQLEHKRRLLAVAGASLVEGGLSVSHGRVREAGGGNGHSTGIALEVSIPLAAQRWQRARRAQAGAEVSRAQLLLDTRRQEYMASLERLFGDLQASRDQLDLMVQRLDGARDAHRVATARAAVLDTDLAAAVLQARFDVYAAASARIGAQRALARARIDLLGHGVECGAPDTVAADADPEAEVAALLAQALPAAVAAPAVAAPAAIPGWYAWQGLRRFEAAQAAFWPALPPAARILLSLDGGEIAALRQDGERAASLRALLQGARARGARVELLLGDPGWAMPQASTHLVGLVRGLARFPFDGVHLDLERMQLPAAQRQAWPDGIVHAVTQLKAASPLPLALSLHPRDARVPGLLRRLGEAGLAEVTFMAYITNPERVAALLLPVLKAHPELRFSVAQSIEPELPPAESHARTSRAQQEAAWAALGARMGQAPNFAGIIVQSLEHRLDGAHHED